MKIELSEVQSFAIEKAEGICSGFNPVIKTYMVLAAANLILGQENSDNLFEEEVVSSYHILALLQDDKTRAAFRVGQTMKTIFETVSLIENLDGKEWVFSKNEVLYFREFLDDIKSLKLEEGFFYHVVNETARKFFINIYNMDVEEIRNSEDDWTISIMPSLDVLRTKESVGEEDASL